MFSCFGIMGKGVLALCALLLLCESVVSFVYQFHSPLDLVYSTTYRSRLLLEHMRGSTAHMYSPGRKAGKKGAGLVIAARE